MSNPAPHPWEIIAYSGTLLISLAMAVVIPVFIVSHCEWVYATTGIPGACGLGVGWTLFTLMFAAIALYSAWQLYRLLKAWKAGA